MEEPKTNLINGVWFGSPVTETVVKAFHQNIPLVVLAGGSYAGKTANALNGLLLLAQSEKDLRIVVFCANFPLLKRDALHWWNSVLERSAIPYDHQKTHHIYKIGSCTIEFRALDSEWTARGAKQDISYIVEVNLIDKARYDQIMMRTNRMMVTCFNPVQKFWLIDNVLPFQKHVFRRFTYKDNPYTPQKVIDTLEGYKETDENLYNVYTLGLWGSSEGTVFSTPALIEALPHDSGIHYSYGLDFGYANDPFAVIECGVDHKEKKVYFHQLFYKTGYTTPEVGSTIRHFTGNRFIFCDSSNPEGIEQLRRLGLNVHPTRKVKNSISISIDYLKQFQWFVTSNSTDLLREVSRYRYKKMHNGQYTDQPLQVNDHAIDAIRYWALMSLNAPFSRRKLRAISF